MVLDIYNFVGRVVLSIGKIWPKSRWRVDLSVEMV